MRLIDLHVHLLPGVDDGPGTPSAAIEHARRMVRDGVVAALSAGVGPLRVRQLAQANPSFLLSHGLISRTPLAALAGPSHDRH